MPKIGDRISEYILTEKCGEGGFGEVWKAHHHIFAADTVAVKIPTDRTYVDFLRNEGVIQHNLQHPHIVRTLGLDPAANPPYFIMEFVEGKTLRDLLREKGRLGFREATDVAVQILEALSHAHEHGITHRDLKPENILVSPAGPAACDRAGVHQALGGIFRVKITDFGLGAITRQVQQTMYLSGVMKTQQGTAITGTFDYMPPEQRRGKAEPDPRSDIYSFGIVFYEMLCGDTPVGAFRYPGQVHQDVPSEVDLILRACLLPDQRERYASAREVLEDLLAVVEGRPLSHVARIVPLERSAFENVPMAQLAPQGILSFRGGQEIATIQELATTADSNWEDAKHHLYNRDVESWLRRVGEKDLSRKAMEIREATPDRNVGLEAFLQATGRVAKPRMELDVDVLDFADVPRGLSKRTRVFINNHGRGWLSGTAVSNVPWLRILTPSFQGDDVPVDILIDTDGLDPGRVHEGAIAFAGNGGEKSVPVRVQVVPQPALLRIAVKRLYIAGGGQDADGALLVHNDGDAPLSLTAAAPWNCVRFKETFPIAVRERYRLDFHVDVAGLREQAGTEGDRVEIPITITTNGGSTVVPVRIQTVETFPLWQVVLGSAFAALVVSLGAASPFLSHAIYVLGLFRLLVKMSQSSETCGTDPTIIEKSLDRNRAVVFWSAFGLVATILLLAVH